MIEPSPDCPLSPCVSLLAGAWTLEIIYLTSRRPMRFGELRRSLAKVSSKVLSTRLRELEARGVLSRTQLPGKPPMVEYALTATGQELMPVFEAILRVSRKLNRTIPAVPALSEAAVRTIRNRPAADQTLRP